MPTFPLSDLERLAAQALLRAGAGPAMAAATARALVYADARGLPSHGVARVPQYAAHLANGRADGTAAPAVVAARCRGPSGAAARPDRALGPTPRPR